MRRNELLFMYKNENEENGCCGCGALGIFKIEIKTKSKNVEAYHCGNDLCLMAANKMLLIMNGYIDAEIIIKTRKNLKLKRINN